MRRRSLAERIVENLVFCVREIPDDPHLRALTTRGDLFNVSQVLRLSFVQEEMVALAEGAPGLPKRDRDELAELLLRLLHSYVADPGEARTEAQLRAYFHRWLVPMIEARLAATWDR
jgi:hypothetical protein